MRNIFVLLKAYLPYSARGNNVNSNNEYILNIIFCVKKFRYLKINKPKKNIK